MHFSLSDWLFLDPVTAGGANGPEVFRFLWPWLIFSCAGLLITFYYYVEGRKRFIKGEEKTLVRWMLDRYLGWFAVICFIALPLIFSRVFLDAYFFAWRVWRYLWLAGLVSWAVVWAVYLVKRFPQDRAYMTARQAQRKYQPKRKIKVASR